MIVPEILEIAEEKGVVYFTSPRWEKRVVCIHKVGNGFISVDFSADYGLRGNVDPAEDNNWGVFLNDSDELTRDDFELSSLHFAQSYVFENKLRWQGK